MACFVEHTSTGSADYRKRGVVGMPAFDAATVRMDASGNVDIHVSAQSAGQDHARVFARLAAQELGIEILDEAAFVTWLEELES